MLELLLLASLVLGGLLVLSLVGAVIGFVFWAIVLPFKIIGWVIHGIFGVVLCAVALPLVFVVVAIALGAGLFALALPLAPLVLFVLLLWWLLRRGSSRTPTAAD